MCSLAFLLNDIVLTCLLVSSGGNELKFLTALTENPLPFLLHGAVFLMRALHGPRGNLGVV